MYPLFFLFIFAFYFLSILWPCLQIIPFLCLSLCVEIRIYVHVYLLLSYLSLYLSTFFQDRFMIMFFLLVQYGYVLVFFKRICLNLKITPAPRKMGCLIFPLKKRLRSMPLQLTLFCSTPTTRNYSGLATFYE
jgi:hypothetical protein